MSTESACKIPTFINYYFIWPPDVAVGCPKRSILSLNRLFQMIPSLKCFVPISNRVKLHFKCVAKRTKT